MVAPAPGSSSIPGTVLAACILWIIYGGLGLLGGLSSLAGSGGVGAGQIIFALAFVITGIQVLMGKASGLIGSGIACILLACLGLVAMTVLRGVDDYSHGHVAVASWVIIIVMINSGLLATAGVLAIVGNTKYKAWRATKS